MQDVLVHRKSGPLRRVLRAGMRLSSAFFPKTATVRQAKIDGLKLLVWANEDIGRRILTTGSFEKDDLARLSSYVAPGDTCIDVGANIGLYSVFLARLVGVGGRVVAFEPVKRNAIITELNCALNDFDHVIVERAPLSNASGKALSAHVPANDSAYGFFTEDDAGDGTAPSIALDDYWEQKALGKIACMKIDVEGAEFNVLLGAERLLASDRAPRVIMMEMNDAYLGRFGHSVAQVCAWMADHGYVPHIVRSGALVMAKPNDINVENVFFRKEQFNPEREG